MSNDTDQDDTEGNMPLRKIVTPAGQEDDDTEGNMPRHKLAPAGPDDDDTEGHLRLTDEQLASGVTPSDVAKGARKDRDTPSAL